VTEREWREASDMRRATMTLGLILVVAAILRFWGLGAGIPYSVGVDEPQIVSRAVHMMKTGDFNPRFYDYPGFYIYVQTAVSTVRFLVGATTGEFRSLAQVGPEHFFLWGRVVTAALGTATVLVVFFIGMRWGTRYALLGAGLMAVMPMHVRESHYVLTDVPATFFVALTFLLTLRAHERSRAGAFAWAGAAAGLAAATKYPGGMALILPLLAVWMTPSMRPSRVVGALAVLGASLATFLAAAPYTVLDLPGFLNGYATLATSYTGAPPVEPGWSTSLKHLRNAFGWPASLAIAGGICMALVRAVRGHGRLRWLLAVVFPVLYFWFVSRQSLIFGRYLLPLVPFLCVLAAAAVVSGVSLLRRYEIPRAPRTALITALTIAALLPPVVTAISFNHRITRRGTLDAAYDWMRQNLPQGSKIVMENSALTLPGAVYEFTTIPQLRQRAYDEYREQGVDYIVASSQSYGPYLAAPQRYPREYADYMRLFHHVQEMKRFTPSSDSPGPELIVFKVLP
jgi:4-amino-4-deoxy-L-arabinose transferase-like glycosyltransferase